LGNPDICSTISDPPIAGRIKRQGGCNAGKKKKACKNADGSHQASWAVQHAQTVLALLVRIRAKRHIEGSPVGEIVTN
jgi:hypothetical protein